MDSNKSPKPEGNSEKDEVNKAEARAKRKEAKKAKKEKKDIPKSNESQEKPSEPKKEVEQQSSAETSLEQQPENVKPIDVNATDDVKSTQNKENLSKSELKAQRRAIQEAQRQAKAAAKTEKATDNDANKVKPPRADTNEKGDNQTGESKAELRAKRRAIQEAQRLAKEKAKQESEKLKTQNKVNVDNSKKDIVKIKKAESVTQNTTSNNAHKKLQLFHHLYDTYNNILSKESSINIHSAIIRLGAQYISHTILGSNARCLALLAAIKQLVNDYRTPPNEEFCRSLENNLQLSTNYLQKCRPLAVSMTNALRHIKLHLTQIPNNLPDADKKNLILEGIDTYIRDEIDTADKAICMFVEAKIVDGDVILIYGCSSIVRKILLFAKGKKFKVIVVDSRPLLEGREMLRKLTNAGIDCSYVLINGVSYIMGKATKVLLGAHSLLANGYVMSRAGTAQIALIARSYNKPVLVCCETYKFCERVQTDSIVHNEIGDPDMVLKLNSKEESPLKDWKNNKYVTPLNLMYDVTPPDLVTAVVTELAVLPCTSVPVILRIKPTEIAM